MNTRKQPKKAGFSLVEILVSVAVLLMLVLLLSQMVQSASAVWLEGQRRADHFTKARLAMDLMATDLHNSFLTKGFPQPSVTGGEIRALTARRGVLASSVSNFGRRDVSYVAYRLQTSGSLDDLGLQRGDLGFDFEPTLDSSSNSTVPTIAPGVFPAGPFQPIGPGILGMQVVFLRRDGYLTQTFAPASRRSPKSDDCIGAFMAIVVADQRTLGILQEIGQIPTVISALGAATPPPDGTATAPRPFQSLESALTPVLNGLPQRARSGLRIFQRYVSLPTTS